VREGDHLTIITSGGVAIRLEVKKIRRAGRATMGTHVIHLKEGDSVASLARITAKDLLDEELQTEEKGEAPAASEPQAPPVEKKDE
jgi:DNA gyrase subunit A